MSNHYCKHTAAIYFIICRGLLEIASIFLKLVLFITRYSIRLLSYYTGFLLSIEIFNYINAGRPEENIVTIVTFLPHIKGYCNI